MFESLAPAGVPFYVDPWAADYGSSLDVEFEGVEEEEAGCDPFVETKDWADAITPTAVGRPEEIAFVDGVQRVEVWGRVPHADLLLEAALASVAVGATICRAGSTATVEPNTVARVLATSSSKSAETLEVRVGGREPLRFEPATSQRSGRDGVNDAIRKVRSELERGLAESLVGRDRLVVQDGRLSFDPGPATPVVGFAKTIHRFYVPEPQRRLVFRLGAQQRTPVFRIEYGNTTRYSWFLRLPYTRPIHHSLAGVVRLETPEIGQDAAIELANLTSFHLPAFASRPEHDPRAPQNLLPVGALERRLRHEMGDALFIRRQIEDHLSQEGAQ